jgi:hypothetical protein
MVNLISRSLTGTFRPEDLTIKIHTKADVCVHFLIDKGFDGKIFKEN